MTQRFSERPRTAIRKTDKKRKTERAPAKVEDEPPLLRKIDWSIFPLVGAVLVLVFVGLVLIVRALSYDPVSAYWATVTARPTLPSTITDTPTVLPTPTPTLVRTRFPTASTTPENRIPAMLITGLHHYGWYGLMAEEPKETQALCNTYTQTLCDYGFSAVNLGLWTGNWEADPQRILMWLKFAGFGRYWYELQDGKGDRANLEPYLEYDHLDLSRGICVPALWNIYTTDRLERLNGLIGFEVRRAFLGEAGVGELDERVSGIPDVLQLEIWDKPPESCIQVIPDGFPARYLPEWVEIEQ